MKKQILYIIGCSALLSSCHIYSNYERPQNIVSDSHFPSNGFRVQSAEDDAALAFQQIVCHLFLLLKILNCGTKLQTLCRLSKRFAENLSRAALPACFSWHSSGRRKALTSRRYPRATAAKKTMQLRCPSKTLCDSCKTPPSPFFTLRTFF